MQAVDILNSNHRNTYTGRNSRNEVEDVSEFIFTDHQVIGLSCDNEYIPFYALFNNDGIFNLPHGEKIIQYGINLPTNEGRLYFQYYADLMDFIFREAKARLWCMRGIVTKFFVMKGIIIERARLEDTPKVLMTLAVRSSHAFNINFDNPDLSQFILLIDKEFTTRLDIKRIYLRVRRQIINPLKDRGVDIIVTGDIHKWCFKNNISLPEFKTIQERKEFLESFRLTEMT